MKYLLYLTYLLLTISCKNRNEKVSIENKRIRDIEVTEKRKSNIEVQDETGIYYKSDKIDLFNFNEFPLSKDIDDISNNDTERYNVNSELRKSILEKENYYKLVYYNSLIENEEFKVFTVFGNYDYYTNILLVVTNIERDSLIDYKVVASIMGDADNTIEISSKFLNADSIEIITETKKLTKNGNLKLIGSEKELFSIGLNGKIFRN
ncbi:hypothetical protein [Ascidiimonas aurantiaca]|uniref:hypothetical protein n=1 Tax=Ascidiimonas aurantiaca TaxID=1685432 RepID=UPI0030EECEF7